MYEKRYDISDLRKWIFILLLFVACQKQVTVETSNTNPSDVMVYSTDAGVASVLTGVYGQMSFGNGFSQGVYGISLTTGLTSDELQAYPESGIAFLELNTNSRFLNYDIVWRELYKYQYRMNAALEGINASKTISDSARRQFQGEAKFMRAFFNFYLVNLFGDVPLVLSTDYLENSKLKRTPKQVVYQQIIADLVDAANLLKGYFVTPDGQPTEERVRPTKMAAYAMLARVYLYLKEWQKAELYATTVIDNSKLSLAKLEDVFLKNSTEAIWQLQPVTRLYNSLDGNVFIRTGPPQSQEPVDLRPAILGQFEPGDLRRQRWIDSITVAGTKHYYPAKYRVKIVRNGTPPLEYHMMLRLGETYLIRAESLARQGRLLEAIASVREIRSRSGLLTDSVLYNDSDKLISLVMHERQIELLTEWGHRWFDLIRTGAIDKVMELVSPQKSGTWQSFCQLFPIPASEIVKDPNMIQNPGY